MTDPTTTTDFLDPTRRVTAGPTFALGAPGPYPTRDTPQEPRGADVPIVAGGQGRDVADVLGSAWGLIAALVGVGIIALAAWGLSGGVK